MALFLLFNVFIYSNLHVQNEFLVCIFQTSIIQPWKVNCRSVPYEIKLVFKTQCDFLSFLHRQLFMLLISDSTGGTVVLSLFRVASLGYTGILWTWFRYPDLPSIFSCFVRTIPFLFGFQLTVAISYHDRKHQIYGRHTLRPCRESNPGEKALTTWQPLVNEDRYIPYHTH